MRANNFIGTKSLEENLRFVPREPAINTLEALVEGVNANLRILID